MTPAAQKLETVFGGIARTRMAGLPIVNPALRVEAVGLREWQGRWAGVLVTPWSIVIVMLPGADAPLEELPPDRTASWSFPSGAYDFMGMDEPGLGPCQICSVLSPVTEFGTQDEARAFAEEVAAGLFLDGAGNGMSRRDFLRMPFARG